MKPAFFQITLKLFLLDQKKRLLVLRDTKSQLGDFPGGRLGLSEIYLPWQEVMEREVREELGQDIQYEMLPEPAFCFPHYINSDQCEGLGIAFRGRYISGEIRLSEEHDYAEWIDPKTYSFQSLYKEHMLQAVNTFLKKHYDRSWQTNKP